MLGNVIASTANTMNIFICRLFRRRQSLFGLIIHGRWNGLFGDWCGDQRTHRPSRHLRTCSHPETRQVRGDPDRYHSALRSIKFMGSIDRCSCGMEIYRGSLRRLGCRWIHPHGPLLFSPGEDQFARFDEKGDHQPD